MNIRKTLFHHSEINLRAFKISNHVIHASESCSDFKKTIERGGGFNDNIEVQNNLKNSDKKLD